MIIIELFVTDEHFVNHETVLRQFVENHLGIDYVHPNMVTTSPGPNLVKLNAFYDDLKSVGDDDLCITAHYSTIGTSECGLGFSNVSRVRLDKTFVSNISPKLRSGFDIIEAIPGTIVYQVLDCNDLPVRLPGYEASDVTAVYMYKGTITVSMYVQTFKYTGTGNTSPIIVVYDTTTALINPDMLESMQKYGKFRSWFFREPHEMCVPPELLAE